jgi:25S rRNA (uracil2634-N3)-methyltransferase
MIGNFSFAHALCQLLHTGEHITATCYDSESILHEKYNDAKDHIASIEAMEGTILYDLNATQLHKHKRLKTKTFDKIIFNFPHGNSLYMNS